MNKIIFILIFIIVFSSCNNEDRARKFVLIGKTSRIDNGTSIKLLDVKTNKVIDSTIIEDDFFILRGKVDNLPKYALLKTNYFSHYRFIWLKNTITIFDVNDTNFRNASVTSFKIEKE